MTNIAILVSLLIIQTCIIFIAVDVSRIRDYLRDIWRKTYDGK